MLKRCYVSFSVFSNTERKGIIVLKYRHFKSFQHCQWIEGIDLFDLIFVCMVRICQ